MYYVRFPLSLRNVEDILHERGVDICHETVRFWWTKLGPIVARELKKKRRHTPSLEMLNISMPRLKDF
jgi:putative transposase